MSKQKWKAWFVTTLVLFTIVRLIESCKAKENDKIKSTPVELNKNLEIIEEAAVEDSEPLILKKEEPPLTKNKNTALGSTKQISKKALVKKEKFKVFKEPSDKVYFKIVDGLALVGGDILIGQLKDSDKEVSQTTIFEKKINETKLWPGPDIPYGFSENVPESLRNEVKWAVNYLNQNTGLNIYPIDPNYDEDGIVFEVRVGAPCASHIGKVGGLQPIFINQSKCGKQEILHEILHSLGFVHEQQRENRSEQLQVYWENIREGMEHNFAILPDYLIHPYSGSVFDIDFKSVMMYPDEAFSKEKGLKTIRSLNGDLIEPTTQGLSKRDIERIDYLYGS